MDHLRPTHHFGQLTLDHGQLTSPTHHSLLITHHSPGGFSQGPSIYPSSSAAPWSPWSRCGSVLGSESSMAALLTGPGCLRFCWWMSLTFMQRGSGSIWMEKS